MPEGASPAPIPKSNQHSSRIPLPTGAPWQCGAEMLGCALAEMSPSISSLCASRCLSLLYFRSESDEILEARAFAGTS